MACTEKNFEQNALRTQPRPQLLRDMARSHFCLIMPGNSQSSGRLADAFFTGCIPVFLGPPFHTLPFAALVRPSTCPAALTGILNLTPSLAIRAALFCVQLVPVLRA